MAGSGEKGEVSALLRCRARRERSAVSRGRGSTADAGSGMPRKRTPSREARARARSRTSRQSTNVMERSVVNEHSSCHMCERRIATDDETPWPSRQAQWQAGSLKERATREVRVGVKVCPYGVVAVRQRRIFSESDSRESVKERVLFPPDIDHQLPKFDSKCYVFMA